MIVFDTDIFSLFIRNQPRVMNRVDSASERFSITEITRIEVLSGRFSAVMTADRELTLRRATAMLQNAWTDLADATVVGFDDAAFRQFELQRRIKHLRKIGRADLLIA